MDNFDIRKYITEAKLSEQKKAYIKYEDGSTEDRMFHQSVSDAKIKKMFAPGTFIDGKQVLKVLVGDSLDQPINEAEEGYNEILQWAEENLDFELSPRMLDDIQNILDDGVPVKVIKKMLSSPTGSRLNESDLGDAVEFYMKYYDENEMPQEVRDAIADALEDGKSLEFIKAQIKNGFEDMVLPEGITEQEDVLDPEESGYEEVEDKPTKEELNNLQKAESLIAKKLSKERWAKFSDPSIYNKKSDVEYRDILEIIKNEKENSKYSDISIGSYDETDVYDSLVDLVVYGYIENKYNNKELDESDVMKFLLDISVLFSKGTAWAKSELPNVEKFHEVSLDDK